MDARIRYKEHDIVRNLSEELDLDKRVIEYVIQSQYRFVSEVIASKEDSRAIRLPYFGVFVMKNKAEKTFYISDNDMKELGFKLIASHNKEDGSGTIKVFRSSVQVHQDADEWYEIEVSDKNHIEVLHFIQCDVTEEYGGSVNENYYGETQSEIIHEGTVDSTSELKELLHELGVIS